MNPDRENVREPMQMRPEDLVKGAIRLISLPEVFIKVSRMVDDPRISGAMIARVIGEDPALTARLLRVANSPLYGFPGRIDTLTRAIAVIGTRGLRDLVLAYAAIDTLSRFKDGLIDMAAFWHRSLFCALTARRLGAWFRVVEPEALFVAGLLHDIGQMIIVHKLPEMARETHLRARDSGMPLHILEHAVIGFDHAEVGGELLRQWLLPEPIWVAVKCHHSPGAAQHQGLNAALIHIAAAVVESSCAGDGSPQDEAALTHRLVAAIDPVAWAVTGLNSDVLIELCQEAADQLAPLSLAMLPQAA